MAVECLLNGGRLFRSGGDNNEAKALLSDQRGKLGEPSPAGQIGRTFAGHMIGRSTQVDTHEFQHLVSVIETMRRSRETDRQPGTAGDNLSVGLPDSWQLAKSGVNQHRVFDRQRLWTEGNRAMFAGPKYVCGCLTEYKVVCRMDQRELDEQARDAQAIDHLGQSIARRAGKYHAPEDFQCRQSVATDVLDDRAMTGGDLKSDVSG